MIYNIHSYGLISSLEPENIKEYLKSQNWTIVNQYHDGTASFWTKNNEADQSSITLLHDTTTYADYILRTKELIDVLEKVEQRDGIEIIKDIQNISRDIWKIHVKESLSPDGTISLEKGVEVFRQIRNLFLASAASANDIEIEKREPLKVYPGKKADRINEYKQNLRLGQTEVGSYVVKVEMDIQPGIGKIQHTLVGDPIPESFERSVNLTLARAIIAMQDAYEKSNDNIDLTKINLIEKTYKKGFSVNLCEAIAEISKTSEGFTDLEMEFDWASKYPVSDDLPRDIILPAKQIEYISKSAKLYRENNPFLNYEVRGFVYLLDREKNEGNGTIGLFARIEGKNKRIRVSLSFDGEESDYNKAIQAHKDEAVLKCIGDLKKEGRYYKLLNPRDIEIIKDEETEDD